MLKSFKIASFVVLIGIFIGTFAATLSEKEVKAANFLASKGIITNNSSNPEGYRLSDTITRKEVGKIVAKLAGGTPAEKCDGKFSDVANDWGCKYIEWMLDSGYIAANKTFRPDDNITKTEAVKLIFKARGIQKIYNTDNWQADYAKTASDLGLVDPYTDYNSDAKRGWIFSLAANDFEEFLKFGEQMMTDEAL